MLFRFQFACSLRCHACAQNSYKSGQNRFIYVTLALTMLHMIALAVNLDKLNN